MCSGVSLLHPCCVPAPPARCSTQARQASQALIPPLCSGSLTGHALQRACLHLRGGVFAPAGACPNVRKCGGEQRESVSHRKPGGRKGGRGRDGGNVERGKEGLRVEKERRDKVPLAGTSSDILSCMGF